MRGTAKVTSSFRQLAVWCLILGTIPAFAAPRKVSRDLERLPSEKLVHVIVQYRASAPRPGFARIAQGGVFRNLHVINSAAMTVKAGSLPDLASDPNVVYVSPDRTVKALATVTDFYDDAVLAPYAWSEGVNGSGIGVAVLDSGISAHKDFSVSGGTGSRIVYSHSFVPGDTSTDDEYGHGTHVAGILAGNGTDSKGAAFRKTFMGIADGANLINLRVLDAHGNGTDSDVIAAIQKAISLKSKYNIRVMNISLGRPVYESSALDPLCQAVEAAWKAGILVVVAAGNDGRDDHAHTDGYGTITVPGNDPYVITVGVMKPMGTPTRADDLIASYSSKGPTLLDHTVKPDIVAPGNLTISTMASSKATLIREYPQNIVSLSYYSTSKTGSSNYFTLSGTSMAAPVVSGAAALLLQKDAALTPDQIKARMMKTAYKTFPRTSTAKDPTTGRTYTDQYDIFTVGAGYLDIQEALESTDLAPETVGSAKSSTAVLQHGNVYLQGSHSEIWNTSVTWGASVVWGTSVIESTNSEAESILWGSSTECWGSNEDQGFSVVWGTSVVWGASNQNANEAITIAIDGEQ